MGAAHEGSAQEGQTEVTLLHVYYYTFMIVFGETLKLLTINYINEKKKLIQIPDFRLFSRKIS
jgi:hypothetical protein